MSTTGNDLSAPTSANARLQRWLKILVAVLGVLIVGGLGAVVTQLVRLGLQSPGSGGAVAERALELPAGAAVRSLAVGGNRLAVHYAAPEGDGVAILDADSGRLIARVRVTAPLPPQ